jgi:hypothetical protein
MPAGKGMLGLLHVSQPAFVAQQLIYKKITSHDLLIHEMESSYQHILKKNSYRELFT